MFRPERKIGQFFNTLNGQLERRQKAFKESQRLARSAAELNEKQMKPNIESKQKKRIVNGKNVRDCGRPFSN